MARKHIELVTKTVASERRGISIPTLNYHIKLGNLHEHVRDGYTYVDWQEIEVYPFRGSSKIKERALADGRSLPRPNENSENRGNGDENIGPDGMELNPEMLRLRKLQETEFKLKDYKARHAELEYRKDAGELVSVEEVLRRWENMGQLVKKTLRTLPDRLAPVLAGETDTRKCWIILNEEIDQCLENMNEEAIKEYTREDEAASGDFEQHVDKPAETSGADA